MKYWLLTTEYPPFYGGGIGTYCFYSARMLAGKGHTVTVFVPDHSGNADTIEHDGDIRIIRFSVKKTATDAFLGYTAYISYEFAHTVSEYLGMEPVPDIIEVQDYQGIGYYLQLFKYLRYDGFRDLTILTTLHVTSLLCLKFNREPVYKFPTFWIGEMEKFAILASDIVISPSEYIIKKLGEDFRLEDRKVHVVPNPIALAPDQSPIPQFSKNEIVFFGKLVYLKGCFELLEYFAELWDNGFQYPLKMIGDGDFILHTEEKIAKDYVTEKYKKYVDEGLLHLLGKLPSGDIKSTLAAAHVVLIPSIFDNLPYTVLEAMSQGKIVLASKSGGHIEVIRHGENGFLFDHAQPGSFARELENILALPDQEIAVIGEEARRTVADHFNFEEIYQQKMTVISAYLQQKGITENKTFPYIRPMQPATVAKKADAVYKRGLLSVVIPYYNMGTLTIETIQSIYQSEYTDMEILLIDDGSDDENSICALEEMKSSFPGIRIIHKKNSGLANTRNFGAREASGEFLAFLDADDTIEPSYYKKAVKVLQHYDNVHYIGCWVKYFGKSTETWPTFTPEPPYFLVHNTMNSSGLVFKKSSFLHGGLNDPDMSFQGYEDWESIVHMTSKGLYGASLPEPLFNYRVRAESMYRKITRTKALYVHSYIVNKHKDLYAKFSADIVNIINSNGSGLNYDNPTLDQAPGSSILPQKLHNRVSRIVRRSYFLKKIALKIKSIIE